MKYFESIISYRQLTRGLLFAFILMFSRSTSQTNTLSNSYTISTPYTNGLSPISVVYGNSLFMVLTEMNGVTITKMDLDGVPILKKTFTLAFSPQEINTKNGYLFISGIKGIGFTQSNPILLKVDTVNFNIDYFREYPVTNYDKSTVQKTKFLSDGNIVMVGSVGNYTNSSGSLPRYGLFLGINSNDGSVITSSTLSVNGSTLNYIFSLTEISNSSLIFAGYTQGGSGFIGRTLKTANTLSVNSVYWIDYGISPSIEVTSNPKKIILIAGGNCGNTVFKIDTNLNVIAGNSPGRNLGPSFFEKTFYSNNKIYYASPANYLRIFDTSLTFLTGSSYPFISGLNSSYNTNNITLNNTNIFSFFSDQQSYSNYYLLKTNLNGQMNCSVLQTDSSTLLNLNSLPDTFISGIQSVGSNTLSSGTTTGTIVYSTNCTNVNVKPHNLNQSFFEIYPNPTNEKFAIILNDYDNNDVLNVFITNSIGKIVQENEITFENHKSIVTTDNLSEGVYLITLKNKNGLTISKRLFITK